MESESERGRRDGMVGVEAVPACSVNKARSQVASRNASRDNPAVRADSTRAPGRVRTPETARPINKAVRGLARRTGGELACERDERRAGRGGGGICAAGGGLVPDAGASGRGHAPGGRWRGDGCWHAGFGGR